MKKKIMISNIVLIGLVSFFVDMSTEMVYPLIPLYLTATLGASPAIIGIIEGVAESLASLLKVFSGYVGDVRQNKKRLAFIGYSASVGYKIVLFLASSWMGVLAARIVDRTGKGIRTAPRDALVAQSMTNSRLGGAYGLHKMLDMAGSAIGALLAFIFVATSYSYSKSFLISIIPALIGIMVIPAIREDKNRESRQDRLSFKGLRLDGQLKGYLAILFIFCLGNSSNAFLLLKAKDNGFTSVQVILLYFIFTAFTSVLAIPAGRLSDRFGRTKVLVPGYLVYGIVYLGFAVLHSRTAMILLFLAYGLYNALISGAERAFVAERAPAGLKGTVLGLYGMLQGIGLLLASMIAGILWNNLGAAAPFWFGGVLGIVSAVLIRLLMGRKRK